MTCNESSTHSSGKRAEGAWADRPTRVARSGGLWEGEGEEENVPKEKCVVVTPPPPRRGRDYCLG